MQTEFSEKLKGCIAKHEEKIFQNELIVAAWYLDKHLRVMLNSEQAAKAKQLILIEDKLETIRNHSNEKIVEVEEESALTQQTDDEELTPFERKLKAKAAVASSSAIELSSSVPPSKSKRHKILENELKSFENMPRPIKRIHGLEWWQVQRENLPKLSAIAVVLMSVPVTEVSVERLFSHLNFIIDKHRSNLKGSLLEDILFLRFNRVMKNV